MTNIYSFNTKTSYYEKNYARTWSFRLGLATIFFLLFASSISSRVYGGGCDPLLISISGGAYESANISGITNYYIGGSLSLEFQWTAFCSSTGGNTDIVHGSANFDVINPPPGLSHFTPITSKIDQPNETFFVTLSGTFTEIGTYYMSFVATPAYACKTPSATHVGTPCNSSGQYYINVLQQLVPYSLAQPENAKFQTKKISSSFHCAQKTLYRYNNILRFSAPSNFAPNTYHIYRDQEKEHYLGSVTGGTKRHLQFVDRHIDPKEKYTYFIVADYGNGLLSTPIPAKKKKEKHSKYR